MSCAYQKILKKITDTDKRLKLNKQDISDILNFEMEEKNILNKQDDSIIEEFKLLKDTIVMYNMNNYILAYQPIKIKSNKCLPEDF